MRAGLTPAEVDAMSEVEVEFWLKGALTNPLKSIDKLLIPLPSLFLILLLPHHWVVAVLNDEYLKMTPSEFADRIETKEIRLKKDMIRQHLSKLLYQQAATSPHHHCTAIPCTAITCTAITASQHHHRS